MGVCLKKLDINELRHMSWEKSVPSFAPFKNSTYAIKATPKLLNAKTVNSCMCLC